MANAAGGRFLLRIEDIDIVRSRPEHVAGIFADLSWLGLSFETPVLHQSSRFDAYGAAAAKLRRSGLLYPCCASRTEIAAAAASADSTNASPQRDPDGAPRVTPAVRAATAPLTARRIGAGEPYAERLDMEKAMALARTLRGGAPLTFTEIGADFTARVIEVDPKAWGDAVLVRKETPASYTLAVVVDDAFQGVTHVTRGLDLYHATGLQRLLQVVLGLPEPAYHHHRLLLDEHGAKLSKSTGATSLAALREAGVTPAEIWSRAGYEFTY